MRLQRCLEISLKNWVINYAVRNGNKVLENHLKTCNKCETYLSATNQNDPRKCYYQVVTEGLLKEVKAS